MPHKTPNICKLFFSLIFILQYLCAFGQSNWVKKEVGNNICVDFPTAPTYKLVNKVGTYTSSSDNCIFIVIAQYDAIPNYSEFVKLPMDTQKKLVELFLDNVIKGMLTQSGNETTLYKKIAVGRYSGRESSYSAINPLTGNRTIKYVRLFCTLNVVYTFQSFATNDEGTCIDEKNIFLNSIKAN